MEIKLGNTVRDIITGFTGVVTGKVNYITGCNQCLVVAKSVDNKAYETNWLDDDRLEIVGTDVIELPRKTTPGFDKPAPIR